jgi:Carboxypeptidase regulatory-like domain
MLILSNIRSQFARKFLSFLFVLPFTAPSLALAQSTGGLDGQILDPSGAVIPGAAVTLTKGPTVLKVESGSDGAYVFKAVSPGAYTLSVEAQGFAAFSRANVAITAGQVRHQNVSLAIAVQQQSVTVQNQSSGVSVNPDENASATVIKGSDLDALSDDPDELQNELQALAGPGAGPNGGQIYIDGFTGGQIPPKSSIREIRVNQNPFSAEFDRIGYGRIEILTKPGSDKFSGHVTSLGNDSTWNTANPLVQQQPSYYLDFIQADVSGPLTKMASYFFTLFYFDRQNQSIIDAINPADTSGNIREAFPTPSSLLLANPRVDFQLGKNNTLSFRDSFYRSVAMGNGPGELSLPEQAYSVDNLENAIQASDTVVVNAHLINETHFQWRRVRNDQTPNYFLPTVSVQGAFTTGGSNSGTVEDHQDIFELQNYSTTTAGKHTVRFGSRIRAYRDANSSTSGVNGNYSFETIDQYLAGTPAQYQETVVRNPLARVLLFDGALFYQDDWRWKPNLTISDGLRFETQNRIRDHADWGPRLALAWAPGRSKGPKPAKTVLRAGFGWFYDRFTVPNSFSSSTGTPYIVQAIHQNGVNQQNYVIDNPDFYNPNVTEPAASLASAASSIPSSYSVNHHFHAALDMQGGVGVDRQIGKKSLINVTYLFTRGVHQYLTDNVTAPDFDPATYTVTSALPAAYDYQFQSEGIYNQNEVIVTANTQFRHFALHGSYTLNYAKSDTQGVTYQPSDAHDLGLDYGRATFGIRNRLFLLGTYTAPHGVVIAPLLAAQSGTPYNLVIGSDLTENNQFNARPTYGVCGAAGVISTPYGCLDTDPAGKGEKIMPYDDGTGPANFVMHMRVSKVIGIGPKIKGTSGNAGFQGNGSVNGRGLSGAQAQPKLDASVHRKYSLTIVGGALNVFNVVNLGTPNGTLASPLFGKTQSLASGPFGSPTPGNRAVFAQAVFTF